MRCENCNVEIACKADKCPLCHTPLESKGEVPFPSPNLKKIRVEHFLNGYLIVSGVIVAICLTLNLIYTPKVLWFFPVFLSLLYIYYVFGVFLVERRRWHTLLLGQILILTAIFIVIRLTMKGNHWIFITWLPAVYMVSDLLASFFLIKSGKESIKYTASLFALCLLGCVPTVCAHVFNLSVKIPSYVATGLSFLILVVNLFVHGKNIKTELKKIFHH